MPVTKIPFQPGVLKEHTDFSTGPRWVDADKIRFRKGRPEQIGGWERYNTSTTFNGETTNTYRGVCRQIFDWGTAGSNLYLGLGTNLKYYVESGNSLTDITPLRITTSAGDVTFSATNGDATITVNDTGHNAFVGDYVTFSGAASLGGNITADVLNHEYEIASIVDADNYTIEAKDTTNSEVLASGSDSGNGGASVVGAYQINTGTNAYIPAVGYSTGAFGSGPWSGGGSLSFGGQLRLWSAGEFGDDLLINPRNGGIYYWDESTGGRAVDISTLSGASNTPTACRQIIVSPVDRHVIAFGVNSIGESTVDPLLIRWASQESAANWTPRSTNTAGGQVLSTGTEIVGAIRTRQEILVFTDTSIHAMRYTGAPFIFSFAPVAENISMVGPMAAANVGDAVYFMDNEGFYVYQGAIRRIRCDVLDHVFENINKSQLFKVFAVTNPDHQEIWWFYPTGDAGSVTEPSSYVIYNYEEDVWSVGTMDRAAWSEVQTRATPIAASADTDDVKNNVLYAHETGYDADGAAMGAFVQSGNFSIGEGDQFMFIRRIIPDFRYTGSSSEASFTVELQKSDFSQIDPVTEATYTVEEDTPQVHTRFRGREMALKISDTGTGYGWVMGTWRFDIRTDGKRGGGAYA